MNHDEGLDIARRIAVGWPVPTITHQTQEVWAEALAVCDYQLSIQAVNQLLREPSRGQPHVSDVIQRAKEGEAQFMGDGLPDHQEVVDYVFNVASLVGRYRWTEDFPGEFPMVREVFSTQEWATRVCNSTDADRHIVAAQIRESWKTHRDKVMRASAHQPAGSGVAQLEHIGSARRIRNDSPSSLPAKREVGR